MNRTAAPGVQVDEATPTGAIVALGILASVVVANGAALLPLWHSWSSTPNAGHSFLVAIAVPLLVWRRRGALSVASAFDWRALATGVAATIAIVVSRFAGIDLAVWCAIPVVALCAMWMALGTRGLRALAGPVGLLLLATPVTANVTPVLQWLTIMGSGALLSMFGVVANVDGPIVTISSGRFVIADGCSGTNYFVVASVIALLIVLFERPDARTAAKVVSISVVTAIVMNWLRVAVIILIGERTAMASPLVENHYAFGWCLFAVTVVPVLAFAGRRAFSARSGGVERIPAFAGARTGVPVGLYGGAGLVALAPLWFVCADAREPATTPVRLPAVATFTGPASAADEWEPFFAGASATTRAGYVNGADRVEVFVATYARQVPGRPLIGVGNSLVGAPDPSGEPARLRQWREGQSSPAGAAGVPAVLETATADEFGRERVVWYWYEVDGSRTLSRRTVRARLALGAFGDPAAAAIVALSARCRRNCDEARALLTTAYRAGLDGASAGTRSVTAVATSSTPSGIDTGGSAS